jgi:plastocyanin
MQGGVLGMRIWVPAVFLSLVLAHPSFPQSQTAPAESRIEVGMGEWAVILEPESVRPGTVTFLIRNKGRKTHGFRIRSGGRGRDRFEKRTPLIPPGGQTSLVATLVEGTYRVECYVEEPGVGDHAGLGMRNALRVTADAPTISPIPATPESAVAIRNFSFSPDVLQVKVGTTVEWINRDPTTHTVTADDDSFDSGPLASGATFKQAFKAPGTFSYNCMIHPEMRGRIEVNP